MSWNVKCHEMSNVMKCQMSWSVKCHEVSKVFKCQTSPNGKCHQISNVKCNQMSNIVKFLMSVEVALCSGPCRVPLQWPPAAAPDYSREISQRLSTQCLSNLFKCNPSILSKQSFYRLTDPSNPRCYIRLRWSCFYLRNHPLKTSGKLCFCIKLTRTRIWWITCWIQGRFGHFDFLSQAGVCPRQFNKTEKQSKHALVKLIIYQFG